MGTVGQQPASQVLYTHQNRTKTARSPTRQLEPHLQSSYEDPTDYITMKTKTSLDVEEELQFHIEMLERKYAQEGMSAAQAKAAASRRFGNLEPVKRQCVTIRKR